MTIVEDHFEVPFLAVPGMSFVTDPSLGHSVETEYDLVACGSPTHDPNRTTILVPTENTVLSLGAASGARKTDMGITGYTDTHIHFETKAHDTTVVSLGGPATTSAITGHGGIPPVSTVGYSMVTSERAWHESQGQHYLLSHEKDISLRTMAGGKRAVVQAEHGFVDVNGGEEVNLSGGGVAIGAASGIHFEAVPYDGHFAGSAPSSTSAKNQKVGMDLIGAVFSAHDLGLKAQKTIKKWKAGELAASEYLFADVLKWIGDSVKFGLSVNKIKKVFAHAASPPGCVKLSAEEDVGGLAGDDVSLSGLYGASLASMRFTTVSAGLIATLKGGLFAGVGSILTSLKGQLKIEAGSAWGDVVFSAKKNVEFTSEEEFVGAAEGNAQVTGNNHLLFGGGHRACIAAEEPSWGALFDGKGVAFGKMSGLAEMKTATVEAKPAVRIDDGKIEIAGTGATITLSNDSCVITAGKILFDAGPKNVTFNGSIAKLGC